MTDWPLLHGSPFITQPMECIQHRLPYGNPTTKRSPMNRQLPSKTVDFDWCSSPDACWPTWLAPASMISSLQLSHHYPMQPSAHRPTNFKQPRLFTQTCWGHTRENTLTFLPSQKPYLPYPPLTSSHAFPHTSNAFTPSPSLSLRLTPIQTWQPKSHQLSPIHAHVRTRANTPGDANKHFWQLSAWSTLANKAHILADANHNRSHRNHFTHIRFPGLFHLLTHSLTHTHTPTRTHTPVCTLLSHYFTHGINAHHAHGH